MIGIIKKILSTFLASTCMFSSVALASGSEEPRAEEKAPKVTKELKIPKNKEHIHQKAFLVGLVCAFDIDVEIKFISDRPEKVYNFTVKSIDSLEFNCLHFSPCHQVGYLASSISTLRKLPHIKFERVKNGLLLSYFQINNHILTRKYISEVSKVILEIIYEKKLATRKEHEVCRIVNLTKDEKFKNKIKMILGEILEPIKAPNFKVHDFYLP